jgi:hypothetical protein
MHHRRWLLAFLLLVSLDFAVPYEPVRGGFELDDEEEAVHVDRRRVERPADDTRRPAQPRADAVALRAALRRFVARRPATAAERRIVPVATQSSDPASAVDDH